MANEFADFVHGKTAALPTGFVPKPVATSGPKVAAPASIPVAFNPQAPGTNLKDFVHNGAPDNSSKVTYFIADGSQKKEDGTTFKPGTVVFRAPSYVINSDLYKKNILPALQQKVQYQPDGTPLHPILTSEFQKGVDEITKYTQQQQTLADQAKKNYKLSDNAANLYATNVNAALSGNGKIQNIAGHSLATYDAVNQFNKLSDDAKNNFLSNLTKITQSKTRSDDEKGRAAALLDVVLAKGNTNAKLLTLATDVGDRAGQGILNALSLGYFKNHGINGRGSLTEQNAAETHLLQHEQGALKLGGIEGSVAGNLGTLAVGGGVGGAVGKIAGRTVGTFLGAATDTPEDATIATRFINAARTHAPEVGTYTGQLGTNTAQQSFQEHLDRTGGIGLDNLGRNLLEFAAFDAAGAGAVKGIKAAKDYATAGLQRSLGNDPAKHFEDLKNNLQTELENFSKNVSDDTTKTIVTPTGLDSIAPRADAITGTGKTDVSNAETAIRKAGYNADEVNAIFAKSTPDSQGNYDLEDIKASADSLDHRLSPEAKSKTVYKVNDETSLGDKRNEIYDSAVGQADLAQAQAAGTVANGLKLDGDVSLRASQAYEAGDKELGDKIIAQGADKASLRSIPEIYENLRKVYIDAGLDVGELDNYISRRLFGKSEGTNISRAGLGKTKASFQNTRIHENIMDYLKAKGEIGDVDIANNLIAYMEEGSKLLQNKFILDGFSRNGTIIYAPGKKIGEGVEARVKSGKIQRFEASQDYLQNAKDAGGNPLYVKITDDRILSALGSKENTFGTRTAIYATRPNAEFLESQFTNRLATSSKAYKALDKFASFSRNIQNFKTAGGVPATALNNLAFTQTIINALVNPTSTKAFAKSFVTSFSRDAVKLYAADNSQALRLMARHGVNPFSGDFLGGKVRGSGVKLVQDVTDELSTLVTKNKVTLGERGEKFDDAIASATFSHLNISQVEIWKHEFNNLISHGKSEDEAAQIASARIKNFFGRKTAAEQGQGFIAKLVGRDVAQQLQTILISAPRYKALNINRLVNTVKAFDPRVLTNAAKRSEYKLNYQLAAAALIVYATQEAITKHFSGTYNPGFGRLGEGQLPLGGGNIARINLFGQLTAVPSSAGRALSDFGKGNSNGVLNELFSNTGYGIQPILKTIANVQYGDKSVRNPQDSAGAQIGQVLKYFSSQYGSHPYIRALNEYAKGESWNAVTDALELPFNVSNVKILGQVDFNNNVVPDVTAIVEAHKKLLAKAYNEDGTPDIAAQNKIQDDMYKDIRDRVNESGKKYGYGANNLTTDISGKLLSLIVGSQAISLAGGVQKDIGGGLDYSQQQQVKANEQVVARQGAEKQGLDLYRFGDRVADTNNLMYGAPKRIAAEFSDAVKGNSKAGLTSLYDARTDLDNKLTPLYNEAKGLKGAAAATIYAQIAQVQKDYMTKQFDAHIAPLIAKYGPEVLANNSDVIKALQGYIVVPGDLTPFASAKKQPYLTSDVKQYLQDRYGVGPLNSSNIATDPEVLDAIKKANGQIASGKIQAAHYTLSKAQQDVKAGKSYAQPEVFKAIAGKINALNAKSSGSSSKKASYTKKTPRFALRVGH